MTIIASIASILVLVIGGITLLREPGYSFDLRRRRKRATLSGGRRKRDQLRA